MSAQGQTGPTTQDEPNPPWPLVGECHWPAPSLVKKNHTCPQCDGGHDHQWVAWPDVANGGSSRVPDGDGGYVLAPGIPVRCKTCGGRKCDIGACSLRRHHRGDHDEY